MSVPTIVIQPMDTSVSKGLTAFFTVVATGEDVNYKWEKYDTGEWRETADWSDYRSGSNTNTLHQVVASVSDGGLYRCHVWDTGYLNEGVYSDEVTLIVIANAWTNGTDEEVAALLDAAAAGEIDLQEDAGWAIGNVRRIAINAFVGVASFSAQEVDIVITSFDDYMNCGNLLQFDFACCLDTRVSINSLLSTEGGYGATHMYSTLLPALVNALPAWLKARLKTFSVLVTKGENWQELETVTNNKLALRSSTELFGRTPAQGEQIVYYETQQNRKKKLGLNGTNRDWWLRTPVPNSSYNVSADDGLLVSVNANQLGAVAPFGCLGGSSDTSPRITAQPQSRAVYSGQNATFTVGARGSEPLSYQWQLSSDGETWVDIIDATSASYTIAVSASSYVDGNQFRCIVTNNAGSVTSATATLTISVNGIEINATNFPDENFLYWICNGPYGWNARHRNGGILTYDEISQITEIWLEGDPNDSAASTRAISQIVSLQGIGYFSALRKLILRGCDSLENLADLNTLPNLEVLYIYAFKNGSSLQEIDFRGLTALKQVIIREAPLSNVLLGDHPVLKELEIGDSAVFDPVMCSFDSINVFGCPALITLRFPNGALTSLDTSLNPLLEGLSVFRNPISSLSLKNNINLRSLSIGLTQIRKISIANCPVLVELKNKPNIYPSIIEIDSTTAYATRYTADPKYAQTTKQSYGYSYNYSPFVTIFLTSLYNIIQQPHNAHVEIGQNATFSVDVEHEGDITYRWECKAETSDLWFSIEDSNSSSLQITGAKNLNRNKYRCFISVNYEGDEHDGYSDEATLFVDCAPEITESPESQTIIEGASVSFSVDADGNDLSYQWQVSTDSGSTWNDIRYATDKDYNFVAALSMNTYQYRCLVSNDVGTVESNAAILTVTADQSLAPPTITTQPSSLEITEGNNATFSVVASGNDLSYQWKTLKDGTWYNINGANSASYTTLASRSLNGNQYRCQVSNAAGGVCSNTATLTVTSSAGSISTPSISAQPRSANVNDGQTAIFSLTADGGGLSYQWYIKRNGQWYPISGATNAIYSVIGRSTNNGTQYRCLVTNSAGSVYSNVVDLNVQSSAPLSFYGYHSIIISGKNTYGEWEMYPTSRPHVAPPEVKTSYVDVPGADGGLDYTDLLTGEPRFGYRKGSWEFLLIPQERWPDVYRSLCNFLNGRVHTVVLEDDPTWQYTGRLSVNKWESAAHNSLITIDYILDPNPVNLDDESYSTDDDDLAAAARILRKPGNEGMVIGMFSGSATVVDPATYFEDGDNISY